jgi:hypothetical protein
VQRGKSAAEPVTHSLHTVGSGWLHHTGVCPGTVCPHSPVHTAGSCTNTLCSPPECTHRNPRQPHPVLQVWLSGVKVLTLMRGMGISHTKDTPVGDSMLRCVRTRWGDAGVCARWEDPWQQAAAM